MIAEKDLILDKKQIDQKLKRIAYEIYENNISEKKIVLAGISDNGYIMSSIIETELKNISPLTIETVKISIDKDAPSTSEIKLSHKIDFTNKSVVLLDDVLNTGKTIAFTLKTFLNSNVKKIEVGVLVNRSHKLFPIYPKYIGYELATTFNEHVEVLLKKSKGVYLYG
ncbi:MAG: phosphoribosyltransferase family protein [Cyclobacteriaceae bacterium]|jgi:pyrimidine operon attenuation protein / uracil phosphoribosyltransferase|nr:phosphoribosyltransferase family protein [Cyclobacteriaceae bacterium]